MAPLLAASARVRPANGGATGRNFGGALLAGFELALMAAIAQEASESAQQAIRPHEVADSVRTPLAPRSQPTAAYSNCFMPTLRRSARRQAAWQGSLPLLFATLDYADPDCSGSRTPRPPRLWTIRGFT